MPFCSMLYNDLLQRTKPSTYFHSLLVTGKFQQRTKLFAHSNAMPFFLVYTISNKKQIQLCVFTRRFLHYLQSSTKSVTHITRKYAFYFHIRIIFFFFYSHILILLSLPTTIEKRLSLPILGTIGHLGTRRMLA